MRSRIRLLSLLAVVAGSFIVNTFYFGYGLSRNKSQAFDRTCRQSDNHRITEIMRDAHIASQHVITRAPASLEDAVAKYRKSRGRHPPPGFDAWYQTAEKQRALLVEDFFDQIYTDLEPFWGVPPNVLRASLEALPPDTDVIKVRNGRVERHGDGGFRKREWSKMIGRVAHTLPDLDILINLLDEPRVVVPWTDASAAIDTASEQKKRMMETQSSEFRSFAANDANTVPGAAPSWIRDTGLHRKALIASCSPGSAIHGYDLNAHMDIMPVEATSFVENVLESKNICSRPELLTQHGFLIHPKTVSYTTSMMPIFSAAKINVNRDVVLPEAAYFTDDKFFSGKGWLGDWSSYYSWKRKVHGLIWRGASTGGAPRESTVKNFHRHRFVSTMNASSTNGVIGASMGSDSKEVADDGFRKWLELMSDVSFSTIYCEEFGKECCTSIRNNFHTTAPVGMSKQYRWKYLPDIDGNSLSGRFRAFMLSNSAVMKATIFSEWHDARLIPWKHYIPFDLSSADVHAIMKYFLGYAGLCAHDDEGESIAVAGQAWSRQALRREDMETYVHRLLLEYARILNDSRDLLGYVEDLVRR